MENNLINNHKDLTATIAFLKAEKTMQEVEIKTKFDAFVETLNPINIIKNAIMGLGKDESIQGELSKSGISLGIGFIVDKLIGNKGIKNFLKSFFIKGTLTALINQNLSSIYSVVKTFITDFKQKDTPENVEDSDTHSKNEDESSF